MRILWIPFRSIASVITLCCLAGSLQKATGHMLEAEPAVKDSTVTPTIAFIAPDTVYWLSIAPYSVDLYAGPLDTEISISGGKLATTENPQRYRVDVPISEPDTIRLIAAASLKGETGRDTLVVIAEAPAPELVRNLGNSTYFRRLDKWPGLRATFEDPYNPSCSCGSPNIPENWYQTIVTIKGKEVFNRSGFSFDHLSHADSIALHVDEGTSPEEINTEIFWRPGGTWDRNRWVLLLSNQYERNAAIPLRKRNKMVIEYNQPEFISDRDHYTVFLTQQFLTWRSSKFSAWQRLGQTLQNVDVKAECVDCQKLGLTLTLERSRDLSWSFTISVADVEQLRAICATHGSGYPIHMEFELRGKGGAIRVEPLFAVIVIDPDYTRDCSR